MHTTNNESVCFASCLGKSSRPKFQTSSRLSLLYKQCKTLPSGFSYFFDRNEVFTNVSVDHTDMRYVLVALPALEFFGKNETGLNLITIFLMNH